MTTPILEGTERRRALWEIWILLALSLAKSGVYAVVDIVAMLTSGTALADQTATLNPSRSPRPYLDLTYQVLAIGFAIVPVLLAVYLLAIRRNARPVTEAIGLDWQVPGTRRGRDVGWGFALAAAIGIPGLAFYALGRLLGITVSVQASALADHWWTVPVLILSAFQNGALEEVIVVAYLFERTRDLGWSPTARLDWRFLTASALLRGSYHLYQGFGPFLGNAVMGVLFAWWYRSRWGRNRVVPLVVAHTLLDVVAFVGYALIPASWRTALGIT